MKYLTKKFIALILAAVCIIGMNTAVAFADDSTKAISGDEDCRIHFKLADKTSGAFDDDVTVKMTNLDTKLEYNFKLKSADYLLGLSIGGCVKQGYYKIELKYESEDSFTIRDTEGKDISSFTADSEDYTFNWEIVKSNETNSKKEENNTQQETEQTQAASPAGAYVADTGDDEADRLWNDFLNKVSVIETDESYATILRIIEKSTDGNSKYYEDTTGNPADEYANMSLFDRFLWYATYIKPAYYVKHSDGEYLKTVDKWNAYVADLPYEWLKTYGTQEMADSYRALMEYDYNYFKQHGTLINFMDNSFKVTDEDMKATEKENESSTKGTVQNDADLENKSHTGLNKIVIIIIIGVVVAALAVGVVVYRKKSGIKDK
ncbi:MAG: hypothetical protein ACI4EU_02510 [Butyrivibrio sp.]